MKNRDGNDVRAGSTRGRNPGRSTIVSLIWLTLGLVLLSHCGPCPIEGVIVQTGAPVSVVPTEEPADGERAKDDEGAQDIENAADKVRCCRWNHYVIDGGGGQTAIAVNPLAPNIVYMTMDNAGIAKSTDYGETWRTINNNIGHTRLADVKLDPLDPDVVYVTAASGRGVGEGELYRSLDGGARWEFLTGAFGAQRWPSCREIVIVPRDADGDRISDVIYIGGWAGDENGDKDADQLRGGVWKSTDEGVTWEQIGRVDGDDAFLKQANVWVLRNDPSNPDVLYAGMFVYSGADTPGGIWKSADGGMNWTNISHDIPVAGVSDIAISPDGRTLYATTNTYSSSEPGAGIYKSTDGGENWTAINHGLEGTSLKFHVLLMDKDDPDVLYAGSFRSSLNGIYKTTDGGQYWYHTPFDNSGWWAEYFYNAWAITEGADSRLYAVTWKGVYRSDDHGESWVVHPRGLGNVIIYDIAVDPQDPSTVYIGVGDNGPWKSTDGGHTWARIQKGYYEPYDREAGGVQAFAISPSRPNIIYSAVRGAGQATLMGVNKTVNGGRRWTAVNKGLPGPDPAWWAADVVVHPSDPKIAYVGLQIDDGTGAVFRTANGGKRWTRLENVDPESPLPRVRALAISASNPDLLVVGTSKPGRIYKTSDGGETWTRISPPSALMEPATIVYAIDIHPRYPQHIIIGVNRQGAFKTSDGGETWEQVLDADFFQANVGDLALNPDSPVGATIEVVKFDPDDPQIIYAGHHNRGMAGLGVVKSTDGGASWVFLSDSGLQYRNIFAMDIHPITKELFVGGFDGVYVYEQYVADE